MSKIVAVSCSPSENDSSTCILDAFLDGAMGLSTNIVTLHKPVKYKSLTDCHRCMGCKKNDRCVINDDVRDLLDEIKGSDCVVFATPVFFNGPSALYKIIEDRMFSFLDADGNSMIEKGKKAVLIITANHPDNDLMRISELISDNLKLFGFDMLGTFVYTDDFGNKPASKDHEIQAKAKDLGKKMRNTPVV